MKSQIAACELNVQRNPNDIASLNQLAMLNASESRFAEARVHMSAALRLAPDHPLLHYNLGQIYGGLHRHHEEIQCYQRAVALKPDFADAYVNMGVALRDLQCFDEAFDAFKQALRIHPDHAGARTNRAQTNLILGNFEHGWREYEWRWQDGHQRHVVTGTLWNGKTSIQGKRLLIHAEQGLGDTIQFVRYIDLLQGLGATLILRVQTPLVELLTNYPGLSSILDEASALPEFDLHIPLLSLPYALYGRHPGIPAAHHYLLAGATGVCEWAARLVQWSDTLAQHDIHTDLRSNDKPLKVGICWSGNPHHLNDLNRSMALADLEPILNKKCALVSLQKEIREADQLTVCAHPEILNAGMALNSFADTAALICNLDLVVTVDTSVAHLSGALGVETWVLLPEPPDWRWLLKRNDSPWYPNMRLFRQQQRGDWQPVVQAVCERLDARIDRGHSDQ